MNNKAQDTKTGNSNDGFIWSQRFTVIGGIVVAIALAAAHFAPVLAGPLEWLPH